MKHDEFSKIVIPQVRELWNQGCLCRKPGFVKLMSFDFAGYRPGLPCALFDLQEICSEIVMERLRKVSGWESIPGEHEQFSRFECMTCGAKCKLTWEQYNIHFDRVLVSFGEPAERSAVGFYLVGFFGLGQLPSPHDFKRAATVSEFLSAISR